MRLGIHQTADETKVLIEDIPLDVLDNIAQTAHHDGSVSTWLTFDMTKGSPLQQFFRRFRKRNAPPPPGGTTPQDEGGAQDIPHTDAEWSEV